jgi:hypothetical protein
VETSATHQSGQYEDKAEATKSQPDVVSYWLAQIELQMANERTWRKEADTAREVYRAEGQGETRKFNILFSNVQTSVPALYNSTPTPDVRTRYNDEEERSRVTGQAIERVLSYSVDTYNFDGTIKACVQDRELAGRGAARVRYIPYEYQGKIYQEVNCEHVPWKHRVQGPCTRYEDMPWLAYEHFLTRDQLTKLSPEYGDRLNLDFSVAGSTDNVKADAAPNVFKRARVWEIWEKASRKVVWIAPSHSDAPIREDEDPLGLIQFFPEPEPLYAIKTSDSMVPVCPYRIIKPLADELEEVTIRIQALVRVCKWRGVRHPAIPSFELLEDAEDGELIAPVDGSEMLGIVQGKGLGDFIWFMPIKEVIEVLTQLYVQREQIKQTIFEVSGLADIMRGQSDPNETLGAQEMKANFGTMRLQEAQKDVQRFCRDLFRIKAEIACNMFDSQNLAMMTGLNLPSRQDVMQAQAQLRQLQQQAQLPPQQNALLGHNGGPPMQQPQEPPAEMVEMAGKVAWEDVLETLKSGIQRTYRVDVETDSTIRGDSRQAQQQVGGFLDGSAKFMQAMGPAVQAGMMKPDVAIDLYASFARMFKLGKQAEDALSRWSADAQKEAKNPKPPPPSPEEVKAKSEQEKAKMQMGMAQQKHQLEMTKTQAGLQAEQQKTQMTLGAKQAEIKMTLGAKEREIQLEAQKADQEFQNEQVRMYADFEAQQKQAQFDMQSAERQNAIDAQTQARKAHYEGQSLERKGHAEERKVQMSEAMAREKHKRDMQKPQGRPT